MQAILANHGNAQMALMHSISNADDKYNLDLKKLAAALENKTKLTNLQYSNITNQFTTAKTDIGKAQEKVDLTFEQLKTATDFGKEQLQMSLLSASEQNKADRQRINMDKYQADINASQSLKTAPTAPPAQKLPLMIPDTVYNKVPDVATPVLPKRNVNTVHDTSFGDALVDIGLSVATKSIGPIG
jgi:type VI protein secretion system component Hcp